MRYLTREWHSGELPDEAVEEISNAYGAHRESVLPKLLGNFREFAETVDIHDALVREIRLNQQSGTLELDLRAGDRQVGYYDIAIHYSGVDLLSLDTSALASISRDPRTEALYHEVDVATAGFNEHRWLWWPYRDLNVRFSGFDFVVEPRPDRAFQRRDDPYIDVGSSAV